MTPECCKCFLWDIGESVRPLSGPPLSFCGHSGGPGLNFTGASIEQDTFTYTAPDAGCDGFRDSPILSPEDAALVQAALSGLRITPR